MKKINLLFFFLALILLSPSLLNAQGVAINNDGSSADASSMLDISSNDKGLLIPRLSQSEISAISNPANGLLVFNSSDDKFYTYILGDNQWKEIAYGTGAIAGPFTCGDTFIDTRDGQSYTTVQIGTQCWMAENLNIGTFLNNSSNQTDNDIMEKYCYNNIETNCDEYGGMYGWDEAMQYSTEEGGQGICPDDWHLPSNSEWTDLTNFLGGLSIAGGKMKETGTTHWQSPNAGADNTSGFTAIGGGFGVNTSFGGLNLEIDFWSSTQSGSNAYTRYINYNSTTVYTQNYPITIGKFYLRCLKIN